MLLWKDVILTDAVKYSDNYFTAFIVINGIVVLATFQQDHAVQICSFKWN